MSTLSNVFGTEACEDLNDHTGGWSAEANFAYPPQASWISKSV